MNTSAPSSVALPREVLLRLKERQLELERAEGHRVTLAEVIRRLLDRAVRQP